MFRIKMAEFVEVREILTMIKSHLLFYEVQFRGLYYLLDPRLYLYRVASKSLGKLSHTWVSNKYMKCPCASDLDRLCVEHVELAHAIRKQYVLHTLKNFNVAVFVYMGVRPQEVMVQKDIASIDIYTLYNYCNCNSTNRELCTSWLYFLLQTDKHIRLTECSTVNPLLLILYWKRRIVPVYYFDLFSHLYNGERRGLMQIALARNRPKGENVIAQFPRDLIKMIFEWVEWSLPLPL